MTTHPVSFRVAVSALELQGVEPGSYSASLNFDSWKEWSTPLAKLSKDSKGSPLPLPLEAADVYTTSHPERLHKKLLIATISEKKTLGGTKPVARGEVDLRSLISGPATTDIPLRNLEDDSGDFGALRLSCVMDQLVPALGFSVTAREGAATAGFEPPLTPALLSGGSTWTSAALRVELAGHQALAAPAEETKDGEAAAAAAAAAPRLCIPLSRGPDGAWALPLDSMGSYAALAPRVLSRSLLEGGALVTSLVIDDAVVASGAVAVRAVQGASAGDAGRAMPFAPALTPTHGSGPTLSEPLVLRNAALLWRDFPVFYQLSKSASGEWLTAVEDPVCPPLIDGPPLGFAARRPPLAAATTSGPSGSGAGLADLKPLAQALPPVVEAPAPPVAAPAPAPVVIAAPPPAPEPVPAPVPTLPAPEPAAEPARPLLAAAAAVDPVAPPAPMDLPLPPHMAYPGSPPAMQQPAVATPYMPPHGAYHGAPHAPSYMAAPPPAAAPQPLPGYGTPYGAPPGYPAPYGAPPAMPGYGAPYGYGAPPAAPVAAHPPGYGYGGGGYGAAPPGQQVAPGAAPGMFPPPGAGHYHPHAPTAPATFNPAEWRTCVDPSGRSYYTHVSGATSWTWPPSL